MWMQWIGIWEELNRYVKTIQSKYKGHDVPESSTVTDEVGTMTVCSELVFWMSPNDESKEVEESKLHWRLDVKTGIIKCLNTWKLAESLSNFVSPKSSRSIENIYECLSSLWSTIILQLSHTRTQDWHPCNISSHQQPNTSLTPSCRKLTAKLLCGCTQCVKAGSEVAKSWEACFKVEERLHSWCEVVRGCEVIRS